MYVWFLPRILLPYKHPDGNFISKGQIFITNSGEDPSDLTNKEIKDIILDSRKGHCQ